MISKAHLITAVALLTCSERPPGPCLLSRNAGQELGSGPLDCHPRVCAT